MKIEIKKLKRFLKNSSKKSPRELINPLREWSIGLFAATILFIGGVSFTAFDFYAQYDSPPEVVVDTTPLEYRQSEVEFYAALYAEKEERFNNLRSKEPIRFLPPPTEDEVGDETAPVDGDQTSGEEILAEEPVAE